MTCLYVNIYLHKKTKQKKKALILLNQKNGLKSKTPFPNSDISELRNMCPLFRSY